MRIVRTKERQEGFALIITLSLLALLVLAAVALSSLTKVNSQISFTALYQTQARQNALLSLNVAVGELQRVAISDSGATALADITSTTVAARRKRWTGVWTPGGTLIGWLVSGTPSDLATSTTLPPVLLAATNTIGTESTTLGKEFVEAPRVPLEALTNASGAIISGSYAYWVADEGVKLSMITLDDLSAPGGVPAPSLMRIDPAQIFSSFAPDDPKVLKVLTYEQLANVKSGLQLVSNFHFATVAANGVSNGLPRGLHQARYRTTHGVSQGLIVSGAINANSTNVDTWKGLYKLACANAGLVVPSAARQTNFSSAVINGLRGIQSNKAAGAPFTSLTQLLNSGLLAQALTAASTPVSLTPTLFLDHLDPLLFTRSDTFRIRSYGDAVNPADQITVEAAAYCEAIVQRIPDTTLDGQTRRYVITYFRWLGPDDI